MDTGGWQEYRAIRRGARIGSTFSISNHITPTLPQGCRIATIEQRQDHQAKLLGYSTHRISPPPPANTPQSLSQAIASLCTQEAWALEDITIPEDEGAHIAAAIIMGTARAVSDGSLKHHHGTSAFTLQGYDSTKKIEGANRVPGSTTDQDPFRAETYFESVGLFKSCFGAVTIQAYFNSSLCDVIDGT